MKTEKKRTTPTLCPHCVTAGRVPNFVHEPPAWMRVLLALRTGIKGDRTGTVGTAKQIALRLGIAHTAACVLIRDAAQHGALEETKVRRVFRKTTWGKLLLQSWIRAGWGPSKVGVSQTQARRGQKPKSEAMW